VLTPEAIFDSTWDNAIKPLLVKRFSTATAAGPQVEHSGVGIQEPYPETEKLFMASFNASIHRYRGLLTCLPRWPADARRCPDNFAVGEATSASISREWAALTEEIAQLQGIDRDLVGTVRQRDYPGIPDALATRQGLIELSESD
jgi:hypothetical protein